MNTFYTKCKDADPIETVLNIIEFFKSHGFTITEFNNGKSEGNTYSVLISPKSNPTGNIGEVWITKDVSYFTVYCSGATRTTTFDYVIFNNDSRTVEGVTN